jgi:predicted ribonuclease toxin of YeeF-YezG toxin-antitoxin module
MNPVKLITAFVLSLCISFAPIQASADGLLGKGAKLYTAAKVLKMARTANKYRKQVATVSKIPLNSRQAGLLKDCLKTRSCMGWASNPTKFTKTVKNKAIKQWEANTGQKWPTYSNNVLKPDGSILAKQGSKYDAHHIIPKGEGGPHEWWNMHPVPRPMHQADVHGGGSLLNQFLALGRP